MDACVVPQRHIVLHLIHFRRIRNAHPVFLPVNGPLLNGGEHFAPAHGDGIRFQFPEKVHIDLAARHPDLQALYVLRRTHFMPAVADLPESVVKRAQIGNSFFLQNLCVVISPGLINHGSGLCIVVKAPRDRCNGHLTVQHRHDGCGIGRQVRASHCNHLDSLCGVPPCKLIIGKYRNGDSAAGLFFHQFRKFLRHFGINLNIRSIDRHHQFDLLVTVIRFCGCLFRTRTASRQQYRCQYRRKDQPCHLLLHQAFLLPFVFILCRMLYVLYIIMTKECQCFFSYSAFYTYFMCDFCAK